MRKLIFPVFILCLNLPAAAIDYNDFPPNLQSILDERIAELESKGGMCIAGRVTMSDGAYIGSGSDGMYYFEHLSATTSIKQMAAAALPAEIYIQVQLSGLPVIMRE